MRWGSKEKHESWHVWFAWRPVTVFNGIDGRYRIRVWCESLWRRWVRYGEGDYWTYRFIENVPSKEDKR